MPKISVIVPVFNTEQYLEKCLTSLVKQTLDDIEIIVVNDGSTDNSQNIIDEYVKKYPDKIKSYKKGNGGLSDARNFGIQIATGKYLGFVDSDDYVETFMYEEMYNKALEDNADFVECDLYWDFPNKSRKDIGSKYNLKDDYFVYGRVMACNKIYKTSIIKDNNILFPCGLFYEDIDFFYRLVPYINKSSYINKILYHYVQRENSIINYNNKNTDNIFTILNNLINYYKENNIYNEYQAHLEYLYIRLLLGSSFKRILKINNKPLRKELLKRTYKELNSKFPNWKENIYLNKIKNKKNLYYKSVNKFTYKIYSWIFRIL